MKKVVGHYEVLEKLGQGGMGIVYKARDMRLDRVVALKMLRGDGLDKSQQDRLVREARTASALNHPNIVTIYEIDWSDDAQLIAMEYVAGITLTDLIRPGGLPLDQVLRYAMQMADAVGKAHAKGIVHRDLKPGNIMVTEDGVIKILDFGLAKKYESGDSADADTTVAAALTNPGLILGTAAYMSPEQALGRPVDGRTDIFSLGVILYELLAGVRPFAGTAALETLQKIQMEVPKPLTLIRPDLPESVERIVSKALAKDRAQRYQTLQEMRAELSGVTEEFTMREASRGLLAREISRVASRPGRFVWRNRWAVGLVGVLLLFGVEFSSIEKWISELRISRELPALIEPRNVDASRMSASGWSDQARTWLQRYDKPDNVDRAIEASKKALERNPAHAMAYAILAEAYYRKNAASPDPQWARLSSESGRKSVELNPELAAAHIANGITLLMTQQSEKAGQEFQRAQDADPLNAAAFMWRGEAYFQGNDLPRAEQSYRRAIQLNPKAWIVHAYLATFFYKNTRYGEAITEYQLARDQTPDNVLVLRNLAAAYHMQSQYEEAATTLQRALEIEPTAAIYANLGTARFFQGRYSDAATAFEKAVQMNPTRYLYWGNLADARRWTPGSERQAKEAYHQAITLAQERLSTTPEDPDLLGSLGVYYAKSGDRERALDTAGRLAKLAKHTPASTFKELLIYEITGNRDRALQALQATLRSGYSLHEIKNEPELLSLRADRRYLEILAANSQPR